MALDCTVGGSKAVLGMAVDQLVGFLGHGVDLGAGGILLLHGLVWNKNRKLVSHRTCVCPVVLEDWNVYLFYAFLGAQFA